jgi:hypothetical protein
MKQTAKRILSFLLCLALALSVPAVPALAAAYALGDVNGDKTVNTKDARLALRAAIGLETLSEPAGAAADVTGDGSVKTDDARIILRAAIGLMRLSKDGKRYEDIPTHGDLLAAYITENGVYTEDGKTVAFTYEYGDAGFAVISYTKKDALPFEVYCYETGEGIELECAMRFDKRFSTYEAQATVFDESHIFAEGAYALTDTRNLNPNTGASCFKETSFKGDPEVGKELPATMAILFSTALSLLVKDLKADGVELTKEDMNLNRVTESYRG